MNNLPSIELVIIDWYPIITSILKAGQGHVFIAGGYVYDCIRQAIGTGSYIEPNDVDFFFQGFDHPSQATECLDRIMKVIEAYVADPSHPYRIKLSRNKFVVEVDLQREAFIGDLGRACYKQKLQFILRLYDNESQCLSGFDLPAAQVGYSLEEGLFCTRAAAFTIVTTFQHIDVGRRSSSMASRLKKYTTLKNVGIILPGLLSKDIENDDTESHETLDLIFRRNGNQHVHVHDHKFHLTTDSSDEENDDCDN
ncbi:MAG: hypothetical protein ACMG6E_01710, partial [Candidatus Roizmanbacteria bacterium]